MFKAGGSPSRVLTVGLALKPTETFSHTRPLRRHPHTVDTLGFFLPRTVNAPSASAQNKPCAKHLAVRAGSLRVARGGENNPGHRLLGCWGHLHPPTDTPANDRHSCKLRCPVSHGHPAPRPPSGEQEAGISSPEVPQVFRCAPRRAAGTSPPASHGLAECGPASECLFSLYWFCFDASKLRRKSPEPAIFIKPTKT